jgi:ribosomal protein S18 acetylase RimI-like enzyme
MDIKVAFSDDPAYILSEAGEFLSSNPVLHNVVLSILHERVRHAEPGRYWMARHADKAVGVVVQSPLHFAVTLTPMTRQVVTAIVDAIVDAGVSLPGANGEAATAASFAGLWTERRKSGAMPFEGNRIYEFLEPGDLPDANGRFRQARATDRDLMIVWIRAFQIEIGEPDDDTELRVDRWLAGGYIWLWEDRGEVVAMAAGREPVAGVVRVSGVYTPPEARNRGYGTACVSALSSRLSGAGYRCILYTDLGNPTSNSIYRRIGYKAVAEALRYRFEGSG